MAMTDGHIFFDVEEYKRGRRPAVNHTLSVTRVGNQTQTQLEKELRRMLVFRLNNYYRYRETSSFGVEVPAQYSQEVEFGQKIEAVFDQAGYQTIPKIAQLILFGLLFAGFWDKKTLEQLGMEKERILQAFFLGNLKNLALLISKCSKYNDLKTVIEKWTEQVGKILYGRLQ